MPKILSGDDLVPGMYVTIHRGKIEDQPELPEGISPIALMTTRREFYGGLVGEPLKILAVELPFIMVRNMERIAAPQFSVDTRKCELIPISREYALAPRRRWWQFWKR